VKDSFCEELKRVFGKFRKYHMKILLGAFSAEVCKEDIFKPTTGNKSLQKISNDNGVRLVQYTIQYTEREHMESAWSEQEG
jgi:hypothetical protein